MCRHFRLEWSTFTEDVGWYGFRDSEPVDVFQSALRWTHGNSMPDWQVGHFWCRLNRRTTELSLVLAVSGHQRLPWPGGVACARELVGAGNAARAAARVVRGSSGRWRAGTFREASHV